MTFLSLRLADDLADDFLAATEGHRARLEAAAQTCSDVEATGGTATDATTTAQTCSDGAGALACLRDGSGSGLLDTGGTPQSLRTARAFVARGLPVPSWVGLMALLEEYVATWDPPVTTRRRRQHMTYAIFGYRCACPMCTRRNVEEHHEPPRSRGGSNRPEDLVAICAPHHRHGVHGTTLACGGKAPLGLVWRVGRADVAEYWLNERRVKPPPHHLE